jgi:hypothetical protein
VSGIGDVGVIEIHADAAEAVGRTTDEYTLACLRYDLSKLRAKGFVHRLDKFRRYRLTPAPDTASALPS